MLAYREIRDQLFAESIDIMAIAALDGLIKHVNPAAEKILGYGLDELAGQSFFAFIHRDDQPSAAAIVAGLATGKDAECFECRMLCRDGGHRWISWSAKADLREHLVYAVGRDISNQKRAEEALRESEARYRHLVDLSPDAIVVYAGGAIVFANPAAARLVGAQSAEQLIGLTEDHFIPGYSRQAVLDSLRPTADGSASALLEQKFVRLDGKAIDVEVAIMHLAFRGEPAVQVMARDISERKRSEAALRAALAESSRRREQTRVLFGAARAVLNHEGLAEAAREVFTACKDLIGAEAGYVALLDEEGRIGGGLLVDMGDYRCDLDASFPMPLRGIRKSACQAGVAVFDNAFAGSAFSRLLPAGHVPLKNVLYAPLLINGKVAGLLGLCNKHGGFTDDDAALASAFAEIIAVALANSRMLESLSNSEQRFRSVVESATDAIVLVDATGRILFCNAAAENTFGHPAEEAIGQSICLFVPERARPAMTQGIAEAVRASDFSGGRVLEITGLRADGSEFPGELNYSRWRASDGVFFAAVVRDITERKRAESALRDSEERYRQLFDNAPIGIYRTTPAGELLMANPALLRLLGFDSVQELARRNLETAGYVTPGARLLMREMIDQHGQVSGLESAWQRRDGTTVHVRENARLVRDGATVYYEGTAEDITERKLAEGTLQESVARLRRTLESTIDAMALTVETRDPYTAGHQQRVAQLALAIAREMSLPNEQLAAVRFAATIHDIGKISVPAEILSKPGHISAIELRIVQSHPQVGHSILKSIEFPWPIADIVLQHHERIDGSGYPAGLMANDILIEARIIAVADVVEAMASHRPYRPALGIEMALKEITQGSGQLYDPDIAAACLRLFREQKFQWE